MDTNLCNNIKSNKQIYQAPEIYTKEKSHLKVTPNSVTELGVKKI